jgi:hypothetical protein
MDHKEIIMDKIIITSIAILFLSGCKITVPYFDDLKPKEVCGGFNKHCQPTGSELWIKVDPAKDYNGKVSSILGRKYTNIFQTSQCVDQNPIDADVEVQGIHNITGTLKDETKNEFAAKLNADIVKLFEDEIGTSIVDLDVDLQAEVSAITKKGLTQKIDLQYKRLHLTDDYIDNHLDACLAKLTDKEFVATGVGVITVKGNWSQENLTNVLAKIEANAGYSALTANAKNEYTKGKQRILDGTFEPMSYFFVATHRIKP